MSHLPLLAMFIDVTSVMETLLSFLPPRKEDMGDEGASMISLEPRPASDPERPSVPHYAGRVQPVMMK